MKELEIAVGGDSKRGAKLSRPGVPSALYTRDYYLTDCGGYEVYQEKKGEVLPDRLEKALALGNIQPGEHVLDIGCGRGEILRHVAEAGAVAVGIDYSLDAVCLAQETLNVAFNNIPPCVLVQRANALYLPLTSSSMDVVFMLDVIEHLYPPEADQVLREVHRVLKPAGRLVIHTAPNKTFVDYGFRWYTRHMHWLINKLFQKNHTLDLRPGLSPLIHVNEQTYTSLRRALDPYFKPRIWLEVYFGDKQNARSLVRGLVTHLYPFSASWPLNRIFAYWLWAVARKV